MKKALFLLWMLFLFSCNRQVVRPPAAEDLLIGGQNCKTGCPTGLCRFGMCTGLLTAPRTLDRLVIGKRVRNLCRRYPGLRDRVMERALLFLQNPDSDPIVRGRAAQAMGMLCKGRECAPLRKCAGKEKNPLRFYCALGLAMAKDASAGAFLRPYADYPVRVRKLARFMEKGGWKDL